MFNLRLLCFLVLCTIVINSCNDSKATFQNQATQIHDWNIALDKAVIRDGFSPPVAARIYAYCNLIYFNFINRQGTIPTYIPPKLNELKASLQSNGPLKEVYAAEAFYIIGKKLVYTDTILDNEYKRWKDNLEKQGYDEDIFNRAQKDLNAIMPIMLDWINEDGYPQTRSMPRYTLEKGEGDWRPTPQDYMEAMEPFWKTIRPFIIDSNDQFLPEGPIPYDVKPQSPFMMQFDSLLLITNSLTKEQTAIARHWDDNSLVQIHAGHSTNVEKKLTPGGHWMNIARRIAIKNNLDLEGAARMYCQLSLGMHDAFIACWQAKYYFHSIRPVTVILEQLDPKWKPLLVTPAFPEYPSGHSVVSTTSATILGSIFGENLPFTDSSEVPFGYPPRHFVSFMDAAREVSDSRYYGGIHFRKALNDGMRMGDQIAKYHLSHWTTTK